MSLRYLFGPVSRTFAEQKLAGVRQTGNCLTFHPDTGEGDITIQPTDSWEEVRARLPVDWVPDLIVLWLAYSTVPACLWSVCVPRLGLAPDWHLLWHYYRACLPACDWVVTDTRGAELLNRDGLAHARPGNLCGCERVFLEAPRSDRPRDIDVLIVGNFNPAVQRERMPWLGRMAKLKRRWRVVLRAGAFGEGYRRLLARSRIVFHASARHKCGSRAFEAAAAGALIFQEHDNLELPAYFRDRQECVYYQPDEVEQLLEYYLGHEEERAALAAAARARVGQYSFEDFWTNLLAEIVDTRWPGGAPERTAPGPAAELLTRCKQAMVSSQYEDLALVADLEKAARAGSESAPLHSALGAVLGRQAQGRSSGTAAAEVAVECFRRALAVRPRDALAGLNLAEALAASGQNLAAIEAARRTLEHLQLATDPPENLDGLLWGRSFDVFAVEWERAAWSNAGRPDAEARAKDVLLRWRLYALLAQWTGELAYAYEAVLLRPDLAPTRAGLGTALLRVGRPGEALPHLRQAGTDNPLDRAAPRACFQALGALGDADGQRRLIEDQRWFSQACPALAPAEPWFSPPRPKGDERASIIILCCNEVEYTRLCLESLLRTTRPPYELILVDNGSVDGTPAYLEEVCGRTGPVRVEIIRNDTNRGFSVGCNQGLARAGGQYVVLLNNDTILTPGWLDGLIAGSLRDWPDVGLVGPVSNAAPDAQGVRPGYARIEDVDEFAAARRQEFKDKTQFVHRLTGFCLLVRREVLERIGGLDEGFGIGFFEDDDLCVRAREAGFRLLVALDVFVHHFGSRTFRHLNVDTRERLEANFELFRAKWGPEYSSGYQLPPAPPSSDVPPSAGEPTESEHPHAGAEARPTEGTAGAGPAAPEVPTWTDTGVRVSLCMIVRNEEHHLPDCLRSVSGLFDEIVVVDTGSTDATREVARGFGARVVEFPWPDSFGTARNESVRHARGKWILWLDADDRLDADNRRQLETVLAGLGDEIDAYAVKVRSVLDVDRTSFRLLDQVRLFRNLPQIRWDYRIHEQILPAVNRAGGGVRWSNVIVDHVGYQQAGARRGKLERNLRLLEMDHKERADDAFTLFNLGWTLLDLGRAPEALEHLRHSLQQTKPSSSTLRKLYHLLCLAHRHLNNLEDALKACRDGLEHFPGDAEMLCEEGLLLRDRGDFAGAERSWQNLLDAPRGQYFASEEVGLRGYRTRQLVAEVYRAQERWVEAEIQWRAALSENPAFEPAWMGLSELYLRQERWADLEYLIEKLEGEGMTTAKLGWLRARGQIQRHEWAAARRTLTGVIAQDAQALGPRVLLSQVLLQEARDWAAAERALRDVLALDPKHTETRHNLEVLLRRLGRTPVST